MKLIPNKKKKGLCIAYRCGNKPAPRHSLCYKHKRRKEKQNNLLSYTYSQLKNNALKRGKSFELTLDQFEAFCKRTNYLELKGRLKKSATIDRIDPSKGYSIDNIQILTLSENSFKGAHERAPF